MTTLIEKTATPENEIKYERNKTQIHEMTQTDIETWLTQLETRDLTMKDESNTLSIAQHLYSVENNTIDIQQVYSKYTAIKSLLNELKARVCALGLHTSPMIDFNGNEALPNERIERIIRTWYYCYVTLYSATHVYTLMNEDGQVLNHQNVDDTSFLYSSVDDIDDKTDKKSPWQELLLFLLNELNVKRYKRYKGQCVREIRTPSGKSTRAWEPVCDIAKFIYLNTDKDDKYKMWKNMTSKGSCVKETITYLETAVDRQFPDVKKNRHVWSFKNGLLVGKYWNGTQYETRFFDYDSAEFDTLDPTIVACKYFDKDFVDYDGDNWYDIPTPTFQSIMDYQKLPEDAKKWLYVFCGRMCFDVNDMDTWQVIPFLKGIAGSGKSKVVNFCAKFYDPDDVRVLSNNVEKKFGLESIMDGFMFISPEIKADIALEQAEFQSLVSGEDMSIARKYKNSMYIKWKVPGMLAGNEQPGWRDNSGSILRRIMTWKFSKKVAEEHVDPKLETKLDAELPCILLKCLRAYLEYAQKYSDRDIWSVVPKYFKTIRDEVAMITSVLQNFLASDKLAFSPDLFVPRDVFVREFFKHCEENNLGRPKFTTDFYAGPFSSREIDVRHVTMTYKGRSYTNQEFIFGVDIRTDISRLQINNDGDY
jgi:hypothetical protein